jgi:anti-sigma B factor antagonist
VKVSGRVDSSTAPELEKALQGLMDSDRNQIVLDLQETEYMSSAGLRVLVAVHKATKKNGGGLCLAQPSTRVREVLDLAGLTPVFDVRTDVVEAVGSF